MSIADFFAKANAESRGVLVGCMPAGFPTVDASIAAMMTAAATGPLEFGERGQDDRSRPSGLPQDWGCGTERGILRLVSPLR